MSGVLVFGGQSLPNALDDIRRYCGLPWSGGPPDVFGYPFFDALPERREDDEVRPVDVLAAAALHAGLRKVDLAYFVEHEAELKRELGALPTGLDLADAPNHVVEQLATMGERLRPACGLSLLSKVLHGKRPRLVPMLDRAVTERYRSDSGGRGEAAWPTFVALFRQDLAADDNRTLLRTIGSRLRNELGEMTPSELRLADIAVWMDGGTR